MAALLLLALGSLLALGLGLLGLGLLSLGLLGLGLLLGLCRCAQEPATARPRPKP